MTTATEPALEGLDDELEAGSRRRSAFHRLLRGRESDPRWVRPSLLGLLSATGLLYLWGLGASGWANAFYSAAVQAGATSWKAFFYGSFDSASFITVDKPPAALWVMGLSARIFGVNSWAILVPQALEGVAAVGLLYLTVRRRFGAASGLLAGAALAITPVAALMFRFNNPDALLVLLLVASAYALTRALERASLRWLVGVGVLIGLGFLTKMLQAFLVVPGFALVYLIAAPTTLRRRLGHLLTAGSAMLVSAGWWVAVVQLVPAVDRPYVGGSSDNSLLNLIFGYNGFGRINGNETGSVVAGGGQGSAGQWGATGWNRLFTAEMGGQIAWLLPAALILLVALLWLARRAPRTDGARAQVLLWGTWLLVTGATFSYAAGIIHPYYNVALAPAIAALVGIGAVVLWRLRSRLVNRALLAAVTAVTAGWSYVLLERSPAWLPWLRWTVLILGLAAALGILVGPVRSVRLGAGLAAAALLASLAGPAAYAVQTAATTHSGAIPTAGPAVASGFGPGGRGPGNAQAPNGGRFPGRGQFPGGQAPNGGQAPGGGQFPGGQAPGGGQFPGGQAGGNNRTGGIGGLLNAGTPSTALVTLLQQDASSYTWVAAAVGANSAAGVQLATGDPIMAIGGFNGTDPTPTLAEFQQLVSAGKVHYFIGGGTGGFGGPGGGGSDAARQITSWVESTFTSSTVGGVTVYDLTSPTSSTTN